MSNFLQCWMYSWLPSACLLQGHRQRAQHEAPVHQDQAGGKNPPPPNQPRAKSLKPGRVLAGVWLCFCLQNISLGCSCLKSPKNKLLVFLLPQHPSQKALLVQKGAGTEEPGSSRGKTRHRGASVAGESPRPEAAGLTTLPQFPCQLGKRMSQFSRARCRGEGGPSAGSMAGCRGGHQGHPQGCWGRGRGAGWVRGFWCWVLPCCVQEAWRLGSTGPLLPWGRRPAHPASGCKCPLGCPAPSPGVPCSMQPSPCTSHVPSGGKQQQLGLVWRA